MKRLALTGWLLLLVASLNAETVLICHAQSLPVALEAGFNSQVSQTLVDMVFDSLFDRGDIAFDAVVKDQSDDPSAQWLSGLSRSYGADKVVYFRVYWKAGVEKEVLLDHVTFSVVGTQGKLLKSGSLTASLVASSSDEAKDSRALGNRLVSGLKL
jgi:hypothetical protein